MNGHIKKKYFYEECAWKYCLYLYKKPKFDKNSFTQLIKEGDT